MTSPLVGKDERDGVGAKVEGTKRARFGETASSRGHRVQVAWDEGEG